MSEAEAIRDLERAEMLLRRRIRLRRGAGDMRGAKKKGREYLISLGPRYVAARKALRRRGEGEPSHEEVMELALRLNALEGTREPAYYRPERKPDGSFRIVTAFGPENYALQALVRKVLGTIHCPRPFMYDVPGRGSSEACRAIMAAGDRGYRWIVIFDIRNCYSQINQLALPQLLPLPRRTTEHVLVARGVNLRRSNRLKVDDSLSPPPLLPGRQPSGLLQGSSASPLVLQSLLRDLDNILPQGTLPFTYGDDIAVLAKTQRECWSAYKTLRGYFYNHPVGCLQVWSTEPRRIRKCPGFEFLGYGLWKTRSSWLVDLSTKCSAKLSRSFEEALRQDVEQGNAEPVEALRKFDQYRAAMPLWNAYSLARLRYQAEGRSVLVAL